DGLPGVMVDLTRTSRNGPHLLYTHQYVAARMRIHSSAYLYVNNNPLRYVDPSGLAIDPIPVPPIPAGICAGTDCDEKKGIITYWNEKDPDKSCGHKCKKPIVEAHEATHRKNMGPCCDLRNLCLSLGV